MIRETYKGRKLKVVKGRGNDFGYARLTVNGVDLGKYLGDEANALRSAKGTIDHADEVGVGSARYQDYWYAPGTFELCENGHAQEIGGECGHSYCIERRLAPEPIAAPVSVKVIRLNAKMVEALGMTIEINGRQAMIMSHPKTQAALIPRGMADEFGYLTDAGRYVAWLIANGAMRRSWTPEQLAADSAQWVAGRRKDLGDDTAVECECGAQWPTGVMGDGHNDMNCTLASQRSAEPTAAEYAQASRAIQAHIPNGRNAAREGA